MKKDYILFIDSGIGGLSTLSETYKLFSRNFIYFSDNGHCPYGSRSNAEIFELLSEIVSKVKKNYDVDVVVLACNTATTSSISRLRLAFPKIKFIGTEPAIKLAEKKGCHDITVLCTPLTAKQEKYLHLAQNISANLSTIEMPTLASDIESFYTAKNLCNFSKLLKDIYYVKSKAHGDALVLGCTHYVLASKLFKKYIDIPVIDGNFGVAKQVFLTCQSKKLKVFTKNNKFCKLKKPNFEKMVLKSFSCLTKIITKSEIHFMFSDTKKGLKEKYVKTFMQILANKSNMC